MKLYVSCYLLMLIAVLSDAQTILYSSITGSNDTLRTEIGEFNLLNCTANELYVDTTYNSSEYGEWIDIALCPDGKLYGLGHDGIYMIDLTIQNHNKILDGPGSPNNRWDKGLICNKDNTLIFGERDVFSYELNTQNLIHLGRLPGPINIWANIFWFNGILMASANDKIIQLNLLNPANSQIFCTLPTSGFLSLIQVPISCDSVAVFAFHGSGDIYLVNPADCSLTYYCTVPHSVGESFQGSTPTFMYMPPPLCIIRLDLDELDETLPGIDYQDTIYCSLPSKYILSTPDLFSDKPWDSLVVWIVNGPPGIFLDGDSPPFATLTGRQTGQLKFYPNSQSDFTLLSAYLNQLTLTGQMPDGVSNMKIGFSGWAKYLTSDTAYAYITLIGRTTYAGEDNSVKLCLSDPPFNLVTLLSVTATQNGQWVPSTVHANIYEPKLDLPGNYFYVVIDPVCNPDTANILIQTIPSPNFDLGPNRLLCPGDTTNFEINLSNVQFLWSNGSIQSKIGIVEPQVIGVTITDEFGCTYSDSTMVLFEDNCIAEELYIPNIFSPDDNGINDEWLIQANPGIILMELFIFDRWGNLLYYDKSPSISWNGTDNHHKIIPSGVYVYRLDVLTSNLSTIIKTGSITLLR